MRNWIDITETKTDFVNELDHDISIEIEDKPIEGVDGVNIVITGPDSESENHITHKEAEMLLRELEAFLESDKD
jgi:hypothetical protein